MLLYLLHFSLKQMSRKCKVQFSLLFYSSLAQYCECSNGNPLVVCLSVFLQMCASLPQRYQSSSGSESTTMQPEATKLSDKHLHPLEQNSLKSASTGKLVCHLISFSTSSQPVSSFPVNFSQPEVERMTRHFFFFGIDGLTQIKV